MSLSTPSVPRIALLCLLGLVAQACSSSNPSDANVTRTDSAGIEIVTSPEPAWAESEGWTVGSEPLLSVGEASGDAQTAFGEIVDVMRFPDGRLVIADRTVGTLRIFDAAGTFVREFGRIGEGPGEFAYLDWAARRGDEIVVHGGHLNRLHVFSADGDPLADRTTAPPTPLSQPYGVFADRSVLAIAFPPILPTEETIYERNLTFYRIPPDGGEAIELASIPAYRMMPGGRNFQKYAPVPEFALGPDALYSNWTEEYAIERHDPNGTLVRSIRRPWSPMPVTEADREVYRRSLDPMREAGIPEAALQSMQAGIDEMIYPDHHPAHERLVVDATEHLWVERTTPLGTLPGTLTPVLPDPTEWDVFGPDGVWLGTVRTPARFWVSEIGSDYIAGVWKDEFDVETARVYALIKP